MMVTKHPILAVLFVAAALAAPTLANAQQDDQGRDHGNGHAYGHDKHDMRKGPGRVEDVPPRWADQPRREWHKGDRLPPEFRDRQYVIDDWRGYHLSQPPRGYQWVGVGGDHLLVQIGSGIVLRIGD
ncbi:MULTISPECIES: RcnB family protein [Burkholderia]|nr:MULTISPECIES: RcnB family protein [Burkholderia]